MREKILTGQPSLDDHPTCPLHVSIAVWPPRECGCGRMAAALINRSGKTRCIDCDLKSREERK